MPEKDQDRLQKLAQITPRQADNKAIPAAPKGSHMSPCESHSFTKHELIVRLTRCIGKTLAEIDSAGVLNGKARNKGFVGNVIEQSVLGYPADSSQRPDLVVNGVETELKSTGIITDKGDYEFQAKEPMSITAVSPETIASEQFATSHFWRKLEHLLLVYYFYAGRDVPYADFTIRGFEFHEWDNEDVEVLESDWTLVRDFIAQIQHRSSSKAECEAQYPRISSELNRQLMYTDTSPKWPNRPRFRLKRRVVTSLVQTHFGMRGETLPEDYSTFSEIDAKCHDLAVRNAGKTVSELMQELDIRPPKDGVSKGVAETIVVRLFGGTSRKMADVELFDRIGLLPKSIVLTKSGRRTEDMKLLRIDFGEIADPRQRFEDSSFRDYFAQNQILLILFEEPGHDCPFGENRFVGFARLWFDDDFIEEAVHPVWRRLRHLVRGGQLRDIVETDKDGCPRVNKKSGTVRSAPNFPKSRDGIVFVRGTGRDATDKVELVNGISMYRQNLWIKGSYLAERVAGMNML